MEISASEVKRLRDITGAGMMECKKALTETDGDFDKAIDVLRLKGQKIAEKRSDREANEGIVVSRTSADKSFGIIVQISCETDFVSRNEDFRQFVFGIADIAINNKFTSKEALLAADYNGATVQDRIQDNVAKIGEKIELVAYEVIEAQYIGEYTHGNFSFAVLVGLSKAGDYAELGKSLALQVAMLSPISIDETGVPADIIERERNIGREKAIAEGKPENIVDKVAEGYVKKYLKDVSLLNQEYVDDAKITVAQFIAKYDKEITVSNFKRVSLR